MLLQQLWHKRHNQWGCLKKWSERFAKNNNLGLGMPKRYKLTKKYVIVVAYIPKPWIGIVPVVTLAIGLPLAGHSEVTSWNFLHNEIIFYRMYRIVIRVFGIVLRDGQCFPRRFPGKYFWDSKVDGVQGCLAYGQVAKVTTLTAPSPPNSSWICLAT